MTAIASLITIMLIRAASRLRLSVQNLVPLSLLGDFPYPEPSDLAALLTLHLAGFDGLDCSEVTAFGNFLTQRGLILIYWAAWDWEILPSGKIANWKFESLTLELSSSLCKFAPTAAATRWLSLRFCEGWLQVRPFIQAFQQQPGANPERQANE